MCRPSTPVSILKHTSPKTFYENYTPQHTQQHSFVSLIFLWQRSIARLIWLAILDAVLQFSMGRALFEFVVKNLVACPVDMMPKTGAAPAKQAGKRKRRVSFGRVEVVDTYSGKEYDRSGSEDKRRTRVLRLSRPGPGTSRKEFPDYTSPVGTFDLWDEFGA
eukprot:comp17646_c1_seq1/m.17412 comp17646_c1_seq1/g.17412  ORF comp17646_c1_seq1/g.17412 comp17646_c1_seq1/m.17412 type:complete len:162 (-) comp17646_c1_seq1:626-1111(-)